MANKVQESIQFQGLPASPASKLGQVIREFGYRLNRVLALDETGPMEVPFTLATYTLAELPDPALYAGAIVYVSDGDQTNSAGAFMGSTGAEWVKMSLRGATWDEF